MLKLDNAEIPDDCRATVRTATLINERCTLPEAVLQCVAASHRASSQCLNLTLQCHEPTVRPLSAQPFCQRGMHSAHISSFNDKKTMGKLVPQAVLHMPNMGSFIC